MTFGIICFIFIKDYGENTLKYYLKAGDAIYRDETNAYGILTRKIGSKWYYALRSPLHVDNKTIVVNEFTVKAELIYGAIDRGDVEVFYGTMKNRRKRKKSE